jgi:indolepyruvate ferredoxin oxidoreductase beta subunit
VTQEVRAQPDQVLQLHEFLHPRVEEIADTLPAPLGRWLLATDWAQRLLGRWVQHGRVVQTSSVRGFLQLYLLAGLRRWRASSLRYAVEQSRIEAWLGEVHRCLPQQPDLALEIVRLQQLIKGYSDTHQRGWQHFCSIMEALPLVTPRADAARCLASLRQAALADEAGQTLAQALQTLR